MVKLFAEQKHIKAKKILQLINDFPGLTLTEISKAMKMTLPKTSNYITELSRENCLIIKKFGTSKKYFLSECGTSVLFWWININAVLKIDD